MDAEGFGLTVGAVQRWLPLGCDVLVRGDRGSGKTTTLEALLADASRRGVMGTLLRANGPGYLAALLDHASAPVRVPDETVLTDWLADELRARRSVLLVDDMDRMDAGSLAVVRRVVGRTPCLLVASTTVDPLRAPTTGMRDVLVERAPAEVRIPPFGFRAVSSLLASVLGAPADAGLTSSVLAQTGGSPRAVVALADAARAAGALQRVEGLWVDDGTLGEVPVDAVAFSFLSTLARTLIDALEFLASIGPVPADVAARIIDPAVLTELTECGRVVSHEVGGTGEMLGVAPPVLARALRERVGPYRRKQLAGRVTTEAGPFFAPAEPRQDDLTTVLLAESNGDVYWRWTAELAGLVHERTTVEETARRTAWLGAPTLANANAYLALLMRRPAVDLLEAVFRDTQVSDCDSRDERMAFRYYETRWAVWRGGDEHEIAEGLGDGVEELGPFLQLRGLKERIVTAVRDGESPEAVVAASQVDVPGRFFRGWDCVMRAGALLESGWPALSLQVCVESDVSDAAPEVRHYLAALRGQSLLMLGRLDEAERWERRLLDTAYDEVDALGIRVHACVLAEVLYFADQAPAAWRVVSTALRLGATGPIESTFYRRGLTIGAVLQAHAGNLTLAQVLVRELDKTPKTYYPLIRSLRVLGHVSMSSAAGDLTTSAQTAWQAGQRYADAGLIQPALLTWAVAPPTLTPARARVLSEIQQKASIPLLEPYLRLQSALADEDRDEVAAALPMTSAGIAPTLVRTAERFLGVERQVGDTGRAGGASARFSPSRVEPLSIREREVATLAREGLSNRQIADRLYLSVRTVENHMSRALRKLGYTSRAELSGWRES